jgi:hypothetical protein
MASNLNVKPVLEIATPRGAIDRRLQRQTTAPVENPQSVQEVSRYVGQMSGEMAALARSARLDVLAYFLEMARIEANSAAVKTNGS